MKAIAATALLFAVLVAGCSQEEEVPPWERGAAAAGSAARDPGKEANWIEHNKDLVRAQLRDGSSAEFRGVFIHYLGKAPLVCGEVNSNNGFGGKAGFQRFIAGGTGKVYLEEQFAAGEMDSSWRQFCTG